ncbi:2-amino-4-hydroxy-6-hydroxymethyldihydropteridine diphosphokinase [Williamsia sp. CHRR-6]|uniref:2-amino-4-hydroxy-6- hydroxymethyldihydropteridine diphosphokinase n=1 Tax=Williamsia sp. CHRR-6 TaxID=2835871 RepID=UPI001BDA98C3|nr:2-amino-4-hydroxy-6-hydroxymethyldihydropteridine diphosphokinase [Williamsia sp. CHRR-6]MBT0566140.1 2-amino-4-hydroxy-6-hydroxymethyldihydropteridine diphosphokinase [Williamsia sp. CHRR-6]
MSRAVLSIGSNMGDRTELLASVRARLAPNVVAASAIFSTPPWGPVSQEDFHNAVLIVDDDAVTPMDWLQLGFELERAAQRTRAVRWGPRTLDVDVISAQIDGVAVRSDDETLTLPHPRAHLRAFVLVPWLDADPAARLWTARGERSVSELIDLLDPGEVAAVTPLSTPGWDPVTLPAARSSQRREDLG